MLKLNWLEKAAITFVMLIIVYIFISAAQNRQINAAVNNAVQSGVITQQAKVIEVAELLTEVKEEVNLQVRQEEIKVEKKHREIVSRLDAKEVKIHTDFLQQPITVDTTIFKYEQLSQTRIDSLWEAYCSETADPIGCVIDVKENERV